MNWISRLRERYWDPANVETALNLADDYPFYRRSGERDRRANLAGRMAALFALVVVVYVRNLVWGGFVWHDQAMLSEMWSWVSIRQVWAHVWASPSPLGAVFLWGEHRLFGEQSFLYHVLSVMVHGGNCILLWLVLRRLNVRGAWLAAALFAVAPVQIQSVAWISHQNQLISAACILAAVFLCLRRWRICPDVPPDSLEENLSLDDFLPRKASLVTYGFALVLAAAAALLHPIGIVLPVTLALLIYWRRNSQSRFRWPELLPFFAIAIAGALLVWANSDASSKMSGFAPALSPVQRIAMSGRAVWFYAINVVRPTSRPLVYPRWNAAIFPWNGSFAIATLLGVGLLWARRRVWGIFPLISALMFLTMLAPTLASLMMNPVPGIYVADDQEYLASIIPLTLIAAAAVTAASSFSSHEAVSFARVLLGAVSLGVLGALTIIQSGMYSNAETAWRKALVDDRHNIVARVELALLLDEESPAQADQLLSRADADDANDLAILDARAKVYTALERYDDAIAVCQIAQRLAPDNRQIQMTLANSYESAGDDFEIQGNLAEESNNYQAAERVCEGALRLNPRDAAIRNSLGHALLKQGRLDEALTQFNIAILVNPSSISAKVGRAEALFKIGLRDESREEIKRAMTELHEAMNLDPGSFDAFVLAAKMRFQMNDYARSEQYWHLALQRNALSAQAWNGLGMAQLAQKHFVDAGRSFEQALTLKPGFESANRGKQFCKSKATAL